MKKLIAGIMSLMVVGAMALPVAAQGRNWNRDDQMNSRRGNNQRDNSGSSRRDYDQRNSRFNGRRGQSDEFDQYGWSDSSRQRGQDHFRFNDRRFNHRGHQH
jgi:hypothetical protein